MITQLVCMQGLVKLLLANMQGCSRRPSTNLRGLPGYGRRFPDKRYEARFLSRGQFSVGDLYGDLSHRLGRLATAVRTLRVGSQSVDMAPQVFEMMNLWESITILARLIATLGRRSEASGE